MESVFHLSEEEKQAMARSGLFSLGITPYYASLMDRTNPDDPLRKTHIPVMGETLVAPGEAEDPLGEGLDTVVPGLIHRYPDRVVLLACGVCASYCRYCFRSRSLHREGGFVRHWVEAIAYIQAHRGIRDVLISGGDPLMLSDGKLDFLLRRLRSISHVEFLRIGSKIPMVLPMRITKKLVTILKQYHPLGMSIHATHPNELTPEVSCALARLADGGILLGSQTVLLQGVNDSVEIMRLLMQGLLRNRVKPYYLYQCDPITGSSHFRTPVDKGLEIVAGLRGHTSGYAVPAFVIDAPGGGGKIHLAPDAVVGREGPDLLLKNHASRIYRYPDPGGLIGGDKQPGVL